MRGVSSSVIRLWCEQSKKIHDDLESSVMWAAQGDSEQCLLVSFETVYVEVVVRSVRATRDEFLSSNLCITGRHCLILVRASLYLVLHLVLHLV